LFWWLVHHETYFSIICVADTERQHSTFGPPAIFRQASKVTEAEDKDEDAEYDEPAFGDRYALTRETICTGTI